MTDPGRVPVSADGHWYWDGYHWRPLAVRTAPRSWDRWLTVAGVVAFMVLAVPVSLLGWSVGSGHAPTDLAALGQAARGCDSSGLQPNGPIGAGGRFCGNLRLGNQLLAVDCSSQTGFNQEVDVTTFDASGNVGGSGSVALSGGSCVMTAPVGEAVLVAPLRVDPGDGVVVTDFTPPQNVRAVIGLDLRCSRAACVGITLATNGQYQISEVTQSSANPKQLAGGQAGSGAIRPNQPNRLVAKFKGSGLEVFLNATQLFAGRTAVPASGLVIFSNHNVDQQSKTSVVKVGALRIFEAA